MTLTPPTDVRATRDGDLAEGRSASPVAELDSALTGVPQDVAPEEHASAAAAPEAEASAAVAPEEDASPEVALEEEAVTAVDPDEDPSPAAVVEDEAPAAVAPGAGVEPDGAPSAPAGAVAASAASEGVEGAPNLADRSRPAAPRRRARPERVTGMPDRGTPRADRPANVPAPQHHHLPGWVRRDFSRARPALADILGILQGEDRAQFQQRVDELTAGITAGKFSLAWQYPALIEEGQKLLESQRTRLAENQRAQRLLDGTRRRSADRLREAAEVLGPEAAARLGRSLRQAPDAAAIAEIDAEVDKALSAARSVGSRRRDREIERTRSRLFRTVPKAALAEEPQSESWQDVLRRFAEEQGMEQQTAGAGTAD